MICQNFNYTLHSRVARKGRDDVISMFLNYDVIRPTLAIVETKLLENHFRRCRHQSKQYINESYSRNIEKVIFNLD